jgi:hypothetical protein
MFASLPGLELKTKGFAWKLFSFVNEIAWLQYGMLLLQSKIPARTSGVHWGTLGNGIYAQGPRCKPFGLQLVDTGTPTGAHGAAGERLGE